MKCVYFSGLCCILIGAWLCATTTEAKGGGPIGRPGGKPEEPNEPQDEYPLTAEDLQRKMKEDLGLDLPLWIVKLLLKFYDTYKDGCLSELEYAALWRDYTDERAEEIYAYVVANPDMKMTLAEFKQAIARAGMEGTMDEYTMKKLFEEFAGFDKRIDLNEFKRFLRSLRE